MCSWLNKTIPDIKGYFAVVPPETYYEWEFSGFAPQNTKLSYGYTRNTKTFDKTVIAVDCGDDYIVHTEEGIFLSKNLPIGNLRFASGCPKSKDEIIQNHKQHCEKFSRKLSMFKQSVMNRAFVFKKTSEKISLFGVKTDENNNPVLSDYGNWDDMIAKMSEVRKNSLRKNENHRAKDLNIWTKINSVLLNSAGMFPDIQTNDIEYILSTLKLKPKLSYSSNWEELFENCDPEAQKIKTDIARLNNLEWVKKAQTI
jgi:hypothetical protein